MTVKVILSFLLFLVVNLCYCQNKDNLNIGNEQIFAEPEVMPKFPGGDSALSCFIDHLINKEKLQKTKNIGTIYVSFIIDTTGKPSNFMILRSLDSDADYEFLRVLKLMPNWEPGYLVWNNKKVPIQYNLPLKLPYEKKFCR